MKSKQARSGARSRSTNEGPGSSSTSSNAAEMSLAAERDAMARSATTVDASTANDVPTLSRLGFEAASTVEQAHGTGGRGMGKGDPALGPDAGRKVSGSTLGVGDRKSLNKRRNSMKAGVLSRGRHADTLQGGVVNRKTGGDARDFGGTGRERDHSGETGQSGEKSTIDRIVDGYNRQDGNGEKAGVTGALSGLLMSVYKAVSSENQFRQPTGASPGAGVRGRPRDDVDAGVPAVPMGRSDLVDAGRAVDRGKAGGGNDGRGDQAYSGSGGELQRREETDDPRLKDAAGGTLNLDAALRLNPLINPGAS